MVSFCDSMCGRVPGVQKKGNPPQGAEWSIQWRRLGRTEGENTSRVSSPSPRKRGKISRDEDADRRDAPSLVQGRTASWTGARWIHGRIKAAKAAQAMVGTCAHAVRQARTANPSIPPCPNRRHLTQKRKKRAAARFPLTRVRINACRVPAHRAPANRRTADADGRSSAQDRQSSRSTGRSSRWYAPSRRYR